MTAVVERGAADSGVLRVGAPSSPSSDATVAALYRAHSRRIHAYCLGQLRDRQEADDAVQSTFVYALALLRRGEGPRSELPWLYTIAHNVCRTRRRALKRRGNVESSTDLDALHETLGGADLPSEEALGLVNALTSLPPAQRAAFVLREWRGLSYAEIAFYMGLTESAVEALLFRARRSLVKMLERSTGVAASLAPLALLLRRARKLMPVTNVTKAAAAVAFGAATAGVALPPLTSGPPHVDRARVAFSAAPPAAQLASRSDGGRTVTEALAALSVSNGRLGGRVPIASLPAAAPPLSPTTGVVAGKAAAVPADNGATTADVTTSSPAPEQASSAQPATVAHQVDGAVNELVGTAKQVRQPLPKATDAVATAHQAISAAVGAADGAASVTTGAIASATKTVAAIATSSTPPAGAPASAITGQGASSGAAAGQTDHPQSPAAIQLPPQVSTVIKLLP